MEKVNEKKKEEDYLDSLLWSKMMAEAARVTPVENMKVNHFSDKKGGASPRVDKSGKRISRGSVRTSKSEPDTQTRIASGPLPSAAEYQALMEFYQAMDGPNWFNNTGWNTANPNVVQSVANFHGVTVDDDGHVKYFIQFENNLNGTIPESFGNLTYLEHIQLVRNPFIGQLPQSIGNLDKVVELLLYLNNIPGTLPATMGNMTALSNVHLYLNNFTGSIPSSITNLPNLTFFSVYDNDMSGTLPENLGNLTKLTHFYINRNSFTGPIPSSIGNMTNIQELYLYSNQLSGHIPPSIGNLTELTGLHLNVNQLTGPIPSSLGNLKKLMYLWLSDNQLSGQIPGTMGGMTQLSSFYIQRNNLSGNLPASLGNLSNLWRFRVDGNDIHSRIPETFGNLLNLRDLYLDNNRLYGIIPPGLCNLPHLNVLTLHNNNLEGDIPNCLYDRNMWSFTVRYNHYFWENLTYARQKVGDYFQYAPQILPGGIDSLYVVPGSQLTLTANDGNYQGTPSTYRWRKDGVPLHDASSAHKSITINCLSIPNQPCHSECEGMYTVEIRNTDFPGPFLDGQGPRIAIVPGTEVRVCTEYQLDPEFNPWLAGLVFERPWIEIVAQCMAEQEVVIEKIREAVVARIEKTWLERYYDSGTTQCLDGAEESLTMTVINKEYHYTLYYYDQSGNLAQTVPPKGVKPLSTAQVNQVISGTSLYPSHELVTSYRYNSKNQLVYQNSPDGGEGRFWYNAIGQLRLSQNARQQNSNQYSYTKYDPIGRVLETGELMSTDPLDSLVSRIRTPDFPQRPVYTCTDITLTGYDREKSGTSPYLVQENLRGRVSWTAQLEKGKSDTLMTVYSYDPHGNVKTLLQYIPGMAPKKTEYQYDLVSGNVNYVAYQPGTTEQLIHRYRYDADNRIEQVLTSTDGHVWSIDATYYYYPHGPLARVELGEHKVQGLDYYYTLQGWLKGVNMPGGGDPGADGIGSKRTGKDAIAFALGYFNGDWTPITSTVVRTDTRDALWSRTSTINSNTGLFNGNITWMNTELAGSQDTYDMQAMVYKYDQLNRIVQSRSLREYTTSFVSRTAAAAKAYDATYTYDGNGNLLTLQRRNGAAAIQDNFTYGYYANSNKLRQTASAQGNNYEYDAIGNLIKDVAGGVTNIEWTPSGKVRKVTKSSGSPIEFRYDASGNRVEKKQGSNITRYIRDASGNVMAVYQDDTLSERPVYGSSRLGNVANASAPGYRTVGHKQYELSNHLGNVLAVVSDRIHMNGDSTWAEVLSRTDYYPFGLEMTGRTESSGYRYGFNGKEKDPSGQWGNQSHYDYGFRIYNPEIGKFLSVDPLADHPKQIGMSPYSAFWNNPIRYNDPDGRCPECEENVIDPTDGQSYTSTGGAEYSFGNGEWTRNGGMLDEVTVTASRSGNEGMSLNSPSQFGGGVNLGPLKDIGSGADYASGVIGLTQVGMLEYRMSLPVSNKIGTFSSFSRTYQGLGVASKTLGRVGYAGAGVGVYLDYKSMQSGEISAGRFGYRTGSLGVSVGTGAAVGGPWGAAAGATVGGISIGAEYVYDNFLVPVGREIRYQIWNFENALKNGWYPGR
ncbi:ATP binding protein [Indibacter alkaliphilus LW1]|uniref:ATP binding protein n=1 Tax=Indibacter alkaliphilus (strain CCUG 57479 / KCTC 22604 / LW1) TaxID=1189612 RepID=S2DI53_INDAL|nr:RHS repeat-associated core domain-containing protein [Indibacter alkaliphilus]EOZ96875.1 ATP binding protein [Indibacter alkaliphilus LW1]